MAKAAKKAAGKAKAAKKPEAAAPALAWMKQTGFEWPPVRKLAEELSK